MTSSSMSIAAACCVALFLLGIGGSGASAVGGPPIPGPAPGPNNVCLCTIASIYDGHSYCFKNSQGPPYTNVTDGVTHPLIVATPGCTPLASEYSCKDPVNIRVEQHLNTNLYPNNTYYTGYALDCTLTDFNGPTPAPAAATPSANAPSCTQIPASTYGPTGTFAYTSGANNVPTTDCTVPDGIVCTITVPLNGGSAKVCASAAYEQTFGYRS